MIFTDEIKDDLRRETGAQILSTGIGDRVSGIRDYKSPIIENHKRAKQPNIRCPLTVLLYSFTIIFTISEQASREPPHGCTRTYPRLGHASTVSPDRKPAGTDSRSRGVCCAAKT